MKTSFFIMWGSYLLNYNPDRIKKNQYPIATLIPQVFAVSLTNNISPNVLYLIKLWVIGQSFHLNQSMYSAPKFNDLDWMNIPWKWFHCPVLLDTEDRWRNTWQKISSRQGLMIRETSDVYAGGYREDGIGKTISTQ